MTMGIDGNETFDFVVVGSGAGGGPLSANLARAGYRVLLLEAGGDYESLTYTVPAFHGLATEDPNMRWDYFVKHYADPVRQRRDSKFDAAHDGILYPRAGTLGGCTAHNAMITIVPHDSDWDAIAQSTGRSLLARRSHAALFRAPGALYLRATTGIGAQHPIPGRGVPGAPGSVSRQGLRPAGLARPRV
jgi:choline dehydrogenase-like flavoprotein